ncbi:MAG: sigma 54-interacting transcriptional regulator [Calditrichia bacterium]
MKARLFSGPVIFFPFMLIVILFSNNNTYLQQAALDTETRLLLNMRGERQLDSNFVVIYIDKDDIENMGGWPVSRDYYGYMAHILTELNARVIAFDILFLKRPSPNDAFDSDVSRFFSGGPTVLPFAFADLSSKESTDPLFPIDEIRNSAAQIGFSNIGSEPQLLKTPLNTSWQNNTFSSFGKAIAEVYFKQAGHDVSARASETVFNAETIRLNHFGTWEQVQKYSFVDVLKQFQEKPDSLNFTDKMVLVSVVYSGVISPVATPLANELPPSLIHLTTAENLINNNELRSMNTLWQSAILLVLLSSLFFWQRFNLSPFRTLLLFLTTLCCVIFASVAAFVKFNLIIPFIIPVIQSVVLFGGAFILVRKQKLSSTLQQAGLLEETIVKRSYELQVAQTELQTARESLAGNNERSEELQIKASEHKATIIRLEKELRDLQTASRPVNASMPETSQNTSSIIHSPDGKMADVLQMIHTFRDSDLSILIIGETGTGKELIAQELHRKGIRQNNAFIAVNCGALSTDLLNSELFGHEKGSFTGAHAARKGRFELANKGTLFLDEITETDSPFQSRLLRVLQEGTFEKVGGEKTLAVDVRVIAATNRNPQNEVESGRFRKDLFYRLNGVSIKLPPLRERMDDIPLLVTHFIAKHSGVSAPEVSNISQEALNQLTRYSWPGNIRELENVIQRGLVLAASAGRKLIRQEDLPEEIRFSKGEAAASEYLTLEQQILESLRELKFSRSAISQTARRLGDRDRGTITEYLRGIVFRTLTECHFDIDEAAIKLAGENDKQTITAAGNKVRAYLGNLNNLLKNPAKDAQSAFRGLPKAYHPFLQQLIDHLRQTSI